MNTFEPPKASKYKGSKKNGSGNGAVGANGHSAKEDVPHLDHRQILSALRAFKRGDFTAKMREDLSHGETAALRRVIDTMRAHIDAEEKYLHAARSLSAAVTSARSSMLPRLGLMAR